MALEIDFTSKYGLTVPNTYSKINMAVITATEIKLVINFYATLTAYNLGNPVLEQRTYIWTTADGNAAKNAFLTAAYTYLATLKDFTGAVSV